MKNINKPVTLKQLRETKENFKRDKGYEDRKFVPFEAGYGQVEGVLNDRNEVVSAILYMNVTHSKTYDAVVEVTWDAINSRYIMDLQYKVVVKVHELNYDLLTKSHKLFGIETLEDIPRVVKSEFNGLLTFVQERG